MGVNSLPKTVTRQRRSCNLNPGPSSPEPGALTSRLPSHPRTDRCLMPYTGRKHNNLALEQPLWQQKRHATATAFSNVDDSCRVVFTILFFFVIPPSCQYLQHGSGALQTPPPTPLALWTRLVSLVVSHR